MLAAQKLRVKPQKHFAMNTDSTQGRQIRQKRALLVLLLCLYAAILPAQDISDIAQIGKSDPLVISGAVGTNNTFYHSTGYKYASPLRSSVWANLNVSVYGFAMPFAMYYTNDDWNFSFPQFAFRFSPTYKNWHAFIGQGTMGFSSYVMSTSVNGFGLEYNDKRLRFGVFYGKLRSAINDDPEDLDARRPQYKRIGWGAKIGYGNEKHNVDLFFLRAYDCPSSIDERWWSSVTPESNLVIGMRGSSRPYKWLSLNANMAMSAFTRDTRAPKVESGKVTEFDKIFTSRYSSNLKFAGDASVNLSLKKFNAALFYRLIQPDYVTLGTNYMSNNYHSLGLNLSTRLFKRVNLTGSFSAQADNLSKEQLYTTKGYVYSANASTQIGKFRTSLRYSGFLQDQGDGTAVVTDSSRVKRVMHSLSGSVSRSWQTEHLSHTLSATAGLNKNQDLNKFASPDHDVKTISGGVNYALLVEPWKTDFSANLSHQQSNGYNRRYTSDILAFTASRSFFEENPLTISATLTTCYNKMEGVRENMSLGGDLQATYSLKKVHNFGVNASIGRSNDVNITSNERMYNVTEVSVGVNYTYTFSLLHIKRKEKQPKEPK